MSLTKIREIRVIRCLECRKTGISIYNYCYNSSNHPLLNYATNCKITLNDKCF